VLRPRGSHVWWVLLGHIGIPLLFGVAFVLFSVASNTSVPTWDIAVETALNFAILGIGATGAIFENDTINQVFKEHSAVVGITVVGVNFLLASFVVLIRRFIFGTTTRKLLWGIISIILGSLALVVTSEVLAYAYGVLPVAH
jgi:hypothetical protein